MHRWIMPLHGFRGYEHQIIWLWALLATLATAAAKSKQFSRGQLIGPGCCRAAMRTSDGGGLRAWEEAPTAEAIAGKRVDKKWMSRTACAVQCAALPRCTHFELNMHGSAHQSHGTCSVFASGGHPVATACNDYSERMACFAAEAFTGSGLALSKSELDQAARAQGAGDGRRAHKPEKLRFRNADRPSRELLDSYRVASCRVDGYRVEYSWGSR